MEEIVGEIWDESDEEFESIKKIDKSSYTVLTNASTEAFFDFFNIAPDLKSEATTVNGWLIEQCGNIPEKDYSFEYENINITVTKADDLMTHEICVKTNVVAAISAAK